MQEDAPPLADVQATPSAMAAVPDEPTSALEKTENLGATDAVRSAVEDASPPADSGEIAAVHDKSTTLTSTEKKRMQPSTTL